MESSYKHTQKGYPWVYWGIPVFPIVLAAMSFGIIKPMAGKSDSIVIGALGGGLVLAALILVPVTIWAGLFMSRLTVWIDDGYVRIRFGFGMWKKTFALAQIQSAAVVRNTFLMGWGIHYFGKGWLYNIAGMEAVELTFKNGKKARIGTDEPEKLTVAIQAALKEKSGV